MLFRLDVLPTLSPMFLASYFVRTPKPPSIRIIALFSQPALLQERQRYMSRDNNKLSHVLERMYCEPSAAVPRTWTSKRSHVLNPSSEVSADYIPRVYMTRARTVGGQLPRDYSYYIDYSVVDRLRYSVNSL